MFEDTRYLVSTKQLEWFADRSMKDFAQLAESVEKAFPGYILPMLPGPEATDKQLQWYLRRLLSLEILRKSPHLASFLMDEVFSPPEPVTTSQKRLQRVEAMWSLSGSLTCDADEGSEHISWQTEFFVQDESAKQKLVDHLLAGEVHQLHVVECIRVSQKVAEYLDNLTSSFLPQSTSTEVYKSLSSLLDAWCHFSELFHSLLKRYIVDLFTAQVQDYSSVGRLIDMRNTYLAEYCRDRSCSVTRDIYGFLNHQSKTEIPRLVEFHLTTFSKALTIVSSELSREVQSLSERWTSK